MPSHSARRFLLEVIFLAGVAAALTFAELRTAAIIGVMAVAWAVVALLEWTAWLDEPHYGRGLPPRYYVPHVALPPPVGVRQGEPAYPVLPPVDDEPTFVASTQEWGLAEWPELEATAVVEDTAVDIPVVEMEVVAAVVPLPPPIPEIEETVEADVLADFEDEPEEDHAPVVEVVEAVVVAASVVEPPVAPVVPVAPAPRPTLSMPPRVSGTATHRVDPLGVSGRRRLFSRRREEGPVVEVVDGPPPNRKLPGRVLEESGRR
jgi:hypothetical protein